MQRAVSTLDYAGEGVADGRDAGVWWVVLVLVERSGLGLGMKEKLCGKEYFWREYSYCTT